jgi:hypothetical protein
MAASALDVAQLKDALEIPGRVTERIPSDRGLMTTERAWRSLRHRSTHPVKVFRRGEGWVSRRRKHCSISSLQIGGEGGIRIYSISQILNDLNESGTREAIETTEFLDWRT